MSDQELRLLTRMSNAAVFDAFVAKEQVQRLKHLLEMFHDPAGCRFPEVECDVCAAVTGTLRSVDLGDPADQGFPRGYFAGWSDAKRGRAYGSSASGHKWVCCSCEKVIDGEDDDEYVDEDGAVYHEGCYTP